jgi:hypothetical protein
MTEPHPDDESLSAALDGEDAAAATHVAGCASCLARTEAFRATSLAVASDRPGMAAAGLADRAVGAALAAFQAERAGTDPSAADADRGAGNVVPLPSRSARDKDIFTSRAPAAGGRRVPGWLMGVAAALLAVLVAVPVLTRGGDDDDLDTAARTMATESVAPAAPIEGGDLGDQSDQLALGTLVTGAISGNAPERAAPSAAADQATATRGPEVAGQVQAGEATGPSPTSPSTFAATPPPVADPNAAAACQKVVTDDYANGLGPLIYRATLRWQGKPAVLLAYELADTSAAGPDHRAFVMALDGCALLVVQGF